MKTFLIGYLFWVVCIIAAIFFLVWFKGCSCGSSPKSIDDSVKVYRDSMRNLKTVVANYDKAYNEKVTELLELVNHYATRADSLEVLRQTDLIVIDAANKKAYALIAKVRTPADTTEKMISCDSLANEFDKYIWLTAGEEAHCDSVIANKNHELSAKDSLIAAAMEAAMMYKHYFTSSTELFGATLRAYDKIKPRNQLSILAAGQYYEGLNRIAIGGGLNFRNKKGYSLSGVVLVDSKAFKIYQLQISKPISFRKK